MQVLTGNPAPGSVSIRLIEDGATKFVEKNAIEELHIGFGKEKPLSRRKLIVFLRKIITTAKQHKLKNISVAWNDIRALAAVEIADQELAQVTSVSFEMANFEFNTYKTKPEDGFASVDTVVMTGASSEALLGFARGQVIAGEVNATRTLSNTPGGDMTPTTLADAAKAAAAGTKATVEVLGVPEMQKLGMGAVLGIGRGSAEEPKFIVVEYFGAEKTEKPVVLIGKGVTFDTGGLNIKTGDGMYEMHLDMSGGAAVIHTAILAAKLGLKVNVVALVPAVENAPGQNAVRPGDILKSLSGKTIEILNTDAEGRVIMADAITYAKKYNPEVVINVSTLTGAALIALGLQASAVMSNDQAFETLLREKGEESGDYVWPFPLWEEYEDMTKGHFGDVPNISTQGNSRYGGVIAGGMFLWQFAKELKVPWAHIDMAPRMTSVPGENLAQGAAGAPVRLLISIIEHYAKR
ncbi:MAG: leucyl aminopeptidase [Patescibacteria group bacterium]